MNLEDYWQENKRFVWTVLIGLFVFLVGYKSIDWMWSSERNAVMGERRGLITRRDSALYGDGDRRQASEENDGLRAALASLRAEVEFEPRARFRRDPALGSASAQYLRVAADLRDELLPLANRRRMRLADDLGMPELSPTDEAEIVRYLEALDLIERVVRVAAEREVGVTRISEIRTRLDPVLYRDGGAPRIEKTTVEMTLEGSSLALLRFVWRTQRPEQGKPLTIEDLEMTSTTDEADEARLVVRFVIPRFGALLEGLGAQGVDA